MKIGILAAGITPDSLRAEFPTYADMFGQQLGLINSDFSFVTYDVREDDFPASHLDCDAWLITGSKFSAYENTPWMLRLQDLIREIDEQKQPLVGICFGHQIIALALGGKVAKYEGGWGLGVHRYEITEGDVKSTLGKNNFAICAFHQDQVLEKPSQARVFARSDFCVNAGLLYGEHILTVQGHPEFSRKYEGKLLDMYEQKLPFDVISQARDSLYSEDLQSSQLMTWIGRFLTQGFKQP
ncbi:glutamine amidotransferase-related protein [Marinomonas sp.]|uniref:glutamine amidotransferase-related protein n=1 Tax=Marinomonas sp. TaxID=1904862 RepID=UPI003BAA64A5